MISKRLKNRQSVSRNGGEWTLFERALGRTSRDCEICQSRLHLNGGFIRRYFRKAKKLNPEHTKEGRDSGTISYSLVEEAVGLGESLECLIRLSLAAVPHDRCPWEQLHGEAGS
jgi:hypothetical protein